MEILENDNDRKGDLKWRIKNEKKNVDIHYQVCRKLPIVMNLGRLIEQLVTRTKNEISKDIPD